MRAWKGLPTCAGEAGPHTCTPRGSTAGPSPSCHARTDLNACCRTELALAGVVLLVVVVLLLLLLLPPVPLAEGLLLHVPAVQLAVGSSGTRAVICICTPPEAESVLPQASTSLGPAVVSCVLLRFVDTPGGSRDRVACWLRRRCAGAVAAGRGCAEGSGPTSEQVPWEGESALRPASSAKEVLRAATKLLSHVTWVCRA